MPTRAACVVDWWSVRFVLYHPIITLYMSGFSVHTFTSCLFDDEAEFFFSHSSAHHHIPHFPHFKVPDRTWNVEWKNPTKHKIELPVPVFLPGGYCTGTVELPVLYKYGTCSPRAREMKFEAISAKEDVRCVRADSLAIVS